MSFLGGSKPRRLLALGAHADDIEIGAGGTLLRLAAEHPDLEVLWVVFCSTPPRAAEARASAAAFLQGVSSQRVVVHEEVDPAIRRLLVPAFIVQPLVENAIQHGALRRTGGGFIRERKVGHLCTPPSQSGLAGQYAPRTWACNARLNMSLEISSFRPTGLGVK